MSQAAKLSDKEWKFEVSRIPDSEIEACFWWEYIRTGLNPQLREDLKRQWAEFCRIDADQTFNFRLTKELRKAFVAEVVLRVFLSSPEVYPDIQDEGSETPSWRRPAEFLFESRPWVSLPPGLRTELSAGFPFSMYAASVTNLAHHRSKFEQAVESQGLPSALEWFDFVRTAPKVGTDGKGKFTDWERVGGTLRVCVDWRFKDGEILSDIARFLKNARPREWPETTRSLRRGLYPEVFTSQTHRAALGWLGVLRRNIAGCAWMNFRDVYDASSSATDLRKSAGWARRIIAWMSSGDPEFLSGLPAAKTRKARAARAKKTP